MLTQLKSTYSLIKARTETTMSPLLWTYYVIYFVLVTAVCLFHEYVMMEVGEIPLFLFTYFLFMVSFHAVCVIYSLLRTNAFIDTELFWITTLGGVIFYNV